MKRRLMLLTPTALLVWLPLSGCASDAKQSNLDLPEKNRAQYVLPLDRYVSASDDTAGIAMRLLMQPCMEKSGLAWAASTLEYLAKPGESWNSAHRKLFSVELAEKYGYGNSDELDLPLEQLQQIRDADRANNLLEDPDGANPKCWAEAGRRIGMPTGEGSSAGDITDALAHQAFDESLSRKSVVESAAKWRECMAPAGVPDLPQLPIDMPSESINIPGPAIDGSPPVGVFEVGVEERRVAVADAKCQESSGYAQAVYDAEWDAQVPLLADNADALERYDKQMQTINRKAEKVIADYTPSSN